jgi:hypothetical protein
MSCCAVLEYGYGAQIAFSEFSSCTKSFGAWCMQRCGPDGWLQMPHIDKPAVQVRSDVVGDTNGHAMVPRFIST